MEEQLISRDCSPPSEAISASVSAAKGCRLLRTRSAPSNNLAWLLTASRTLAPKAVMASKAATPKVMAEIARRSRFLLPRLSRQAVLQTQAVVFIYYHASSQSNDPLSLLGQFGIMGH